MATLRLGPPCALRLIRAALRLASDPGSAKMGSPGLAAGTKKRDDPKTAPLCFTLEGLQKFIELIITERAHLELWHHSKLVASE